MAAAAGRLRRYSKRTKLHGLHPNEVDGRSRQFIGTKLHERSFSDRPSGPASSHRTGEERSRSRVRRGFSRDWKRNRAFSSRGEDQRRLGLHVCGGINPYTFTARLGPGDLAHYETRSRLDPTAWSFAQRNKTWRSSRILVG